MRRVLGACHRITGEDAPGTLCQKRGRQAPQGFPLGDGVNDKRTSQQEQRNGVRRGRADPAKNEPSNGPTVSSPRPKRVTMLPATMASSVKPVEATSASRTARASLHAGESGDVQPSCRLMRPIAPRQLHNTETANAATPDPQARAEAVEASLSQWQATRKGSVARSAANPPKVARVGRSQ